MKTILRLFIYLTLLGTSELSIGQSRPFSSELIIPEIEKYNIPPSYNHGADSLNEFFLFNYADPSTGIEGTIFIEFKILEDGQIDNIRIIRGLTPKLDNEASRVLKLTSGDWSPAKLNGNMVTTTVLYKFVVLSGNYQRYKNIYKSQIKEINKLIKEGDYNKAVKHLNALSRLKPTDIDLCQLRNKLPEIHKSNLRIKICE
jgi:hypothetical protein